MKRKTEREGQLFHYQSERGAALVTVLLLSTLLLSAGLTLIVTTSLSNTTSVDATAEMQAYFGAEAGIEATLNVLRGNVAPDSSLAGTKINFRNAANPPTSDKTSDTLKSGNAAVARLSGWLNYSYQSSSSTNDWRVPITSNYSPLTGVAYKIVITDPDDPGSLATRKITTDATYVPSRLLIQSTGYGPKGSLKRMESVVSRSLFDYSPLATLMFRGADDGTTMSCLSIGNSNAKTYSGYDNADPTKSIPVFGTTSANDFSNTTNVINGSKPNTVSGVQKVGQFSNSQLPAFLQSADSARNFLTSLQAAAAGSGRYFTSDSGVDFGSDSAPQFTFIDGDANLGGGAGLVVVTGSLTMSGNPSFNGVILVLGNGSIQRNGGGNGNLYGATVVAKFARTWPGSENGQSHPFLSPCYDTNGGGNSTVGYDSNQVNKALNTTGLRLVGVREY